MKELPGVSTTNEKLNHFTNPNADISFAIFMQPANQNTKVSHGGPVGSGIDVYHGMAAWLLKNGWNVKKVDENLNVSPTHQQYYALTMAQKQDLEGKIKSGLAQAAQAVADFELLDHDRRKLEEMVRYFNDVEEGTKLAKAKNEGEKKKVLESVRKTDKGEKRKEEDVKRDADRAESALKAIFIDQVDAFTGSTAILQIIPRWPTLIVDFQRLGGRDLEKKDITKELGVSEAEATLLQVKQKLYLEWKNLFGEAVKERYQRILGLVEGRKKSIEIYKNWIRPYITRHSMIKDKFEDPRQSGEVLRDAFSTSGTATAKHSITLWAFKPFHLPDFYKVSSERMERKGSKPHDTVFPHNTTPWDELAQIVLLGSGDPPEGTGKRLRLPGWGPKDPSDKAGYYTGLKGIYPWVKRSHVEKWVKEALDEMKDSYIKSTTLYYQLMIVQLERGVTRAPSGETEDTDVRIRHYLASANCMLIKLVELKAAEEDFERSIDMIMGLSDAKSGKPIGDLLKDRYPIYYDRKEEEKKASKSERKLIQWLRQFKPFSVIADTTGWLVRDAFGKVGIQVAFFKGRGPYEPTFKDIMTAGYFRAMGADFGALVGAVREMMGG